MIFVMGVPDKFADQALMSWKSARWLSYFTKKYKYISAFIFHISLLIQTYFIT
jgi:hypothetical protein